MRRAELLTAGLLLGLALFFFAKTGEFPRPAEPGVPGPAIFPRLLLIFLAFLSLALAARAYRRTEPGALVFPKAGRVPVAAGGMVLYLVLLPVIGFFVTTPLYLVGMMRLIHVRSWPLVVMVTAGYCLAVYLLFVRILGLPLPPGLSR